MMERIEKIINDLKLSDNDAARLRDAYKMAESAHSTQLRSSGEPYIIHPLAVAEILADYCMDTDTIIAGLLHDCIEDTDITYQDIKAKFGADVAEMVEGVTKLTRMPYDTKEEEQIESIRKMFLAMARDIRVILIKLVDRLHNMRTLMYRSPDKQRLKALESMQVYAPIAHRLGMNEIKVELEDLSIMYLDPVGYKEITDYLESSNTEGKALINSIIKRISERLGTENIKCDVQGRIKHVYGIYRKVFMQNHDIHEVYDIYALRVIVDTIPQCYAALGVVHELYHPLPGRFKDYIFTPKPNMYQSLHTTVMGNDGQPFEVQIRTWEMHNTAEYGIAAHWKYKDNITRSGDEELFAWVRRFLESQQENDSEDFFSDLRIELFADEVFVFTPKGDVINLPAGATPIDFAYAIHSAVGNRMIGARVNGRIVQLDHELSSGDIVEVVTSNAAKGPSRDWLQIAKTGEARNKIKQWYKKERREENIERGQDEFESELRRNLLTKIFEQPEVKEAILKRYDFASLEDMYASFGYGGITVKKVINRVMEERLRQEKQARAATRIVKDVKPKSGVIVEGVDNCLIKFARCCTPIPGDGIIGYITKGFGVSVHRSDCPNILNMVGDPEQAERLIKVNWADSTREIYPTSLMISAEDRIGLIADIAVAISELNISMTNIMAHDMGRERGHTANIDITLNLKSAEQLGSIVIRLKKIPGVRDVERKIK